MRLVDPTSDQLAVLSPHLPATHAVVDGDRLLGGLAVTRVRPGTSEIAFWVVPEERRRGVATCAVRELSRRAGERLELATEVTDTISQRVALNAGFTREAVRRGAAPQGDDVLWARLPDDDLGPAARPLPDLPDGELRDGEIALRPWRPDDAADVFALLTLPDVRARMVYPGPPTREEVTRKCRNAASEWLVGNRAEFTIRVDSAFAGDIGLYRETFSHQAYLGYSMSPEFRGRGVTTRAVRLLSAWAFEVGVKRLVAGTMPDNVASQRVLAKAGFVRESVQRARFERADGTRFDDVVHVLFPPTSA